MPADVLDWTLVRPDDLPPELAEFGEAVAGCETVLEAAARIVEAFGGSTVYVPSLRDLRRVQLAKRAVRLVEPAALGGEGLTPGQAARLLGVTRRHLAALIRSANATCEPKPDGGKRHPKPPRESF
jgi:hypothetical protein